MNKKVLILTVAMTLVMAGGAWATDYFSEPFDAGLGQFTATNNGGDCIWVSPDPDGIYTAYFGDANYAIANSDACGAGTTMDTSITTADIDCSAATTVYLKYNHYYRYLASDSGTVEVSGNSGGAWTTYATYGASSDGLEFIDVTATAAGSSQVQIRYTYVAPGWDWYWGVDNVALTDDTTIVDLTANSTAESGRPGKNVRYYFMITQVGGDDATIDLTYTGNAWTVDGPATIDVASGATEYFEVEVTIDPAATGGETDTVTVTADMGGTTDTEDLTSTAMAPFLFSPTWTDTPPTIDGAIDDVTEWAGAEYISVTGGALDYDMYYMADAQYLYVGFDVLGDTTATDWDQIGLYFDNDNNGQWPPACPNTEGNYWVEYFGTGMVVDYRTWFDDGSGPGVCGVVTATAVTSAAALSAKGNMQYEVAVDYTGGELYGAPGELVGWRVYASDADGALMGWPADSLYNYPVTYATLEYPTAGDDDTIDDDTIDDDVVDDDVVDDDVVDDDVVDDDVVDDDVVDDDVVDDDVVDDDVVDDDVVDDDVVDDDVVDDDLGDDDLGDDDLGDDDDDDDDSSCCGC